MSVFVEEGGHLDIIFLNETFPLYGNLFPINSHSEINYQTETTLVNK